MQLVGNKFDDARVVQAARAFETAHSFVLPDVAAILKSAASPAPAQSAG
jgi:Asp-tRNA(Asn)/Glu-tRNA(Gln) amidotransferase A subunit family amidase